MERIIHDKVRDGLKAWMPDLDGFFDRLEPRYEKMLVELFSKLGIHASVKTDRKSLPHTREVVVRMMRCSDINSMYATEPVFRAIVKDVLDNAGYKIRFYLHVDTYDDGNTGFLGAITGTGFRFTFRYYIH